MLHRKKKANKRECGAVFEKEQNQKVLEKVKAPLCLLIKIGVL